MSTIDARPGQTYTITTIQYSSDKGIQVGETTGKLQIFILADRVKVFDICELSNDGIDELIRGLVLAKKILL